MWRVNHGPKIDIYQTLKPSNFCVFSLSVISKLRPLSRTQAPYTNGLIRYDPHKPARQVNKQDCMKRIHNKHPNVVRDLTAYGVHHNLDHKVVGRFFGRIEAPVRISECRIFHDFSIGAFTYLSGGFFYHTHIGRYGSFANGLHIGQGNHPIDWLSTHPFQYQPLKYPVGAGYKDRDIYYEDADKADNSIVQKPGRTVIGNDVWVGYGAYIRNGVTIGDGAVIGACSVVTKDVPPYAVVVGQPAKVVKYRFADSTIERLMAARWWRFAPWQLRHVKFDDIKQALDQLEAFLAEDPEPYTSNLIDLHR